MKNIVLVFFCFLSVTALSQNAHAWDIEGNPISYSDSDSDEVESIHMIANKHFPEKQIFVLTSHESRFDDSEYHIVHEKFSYDPMFILQIGEELSEKQIRMIPFVIQSFQERHRWTSYNIDRNHMIEYDIKNAIEAQLTDMWFVKALGKPDNSYTNSGGYKSYRYNGNKKSIVLIFNNGVIIDYKIHGGF